VAPALAICEVSRGVEVGVGGAVEKLLTLLVGVQLRIKVAEGDGRRDNAKSCHKCVVGGTKACEDEGDVLSCGDRAADSGKFIDYALHLGEICRRGHVELLCVGRAMRRFVTLASH
jgi:hypothetical protein